jgi:hypothetical protein
MITIVGARACGLFKLRLTFSDGTVGVADVSDIPRSGVFADWTDERFFASVKAEAGTVVWPNGSDLDPHVLYAKVRGISIQQALEVAFS